MYLAECAAWLAGRRAPLTRSGTCGLGSTPICWAVLRYMGRGRLVVTVVRTRMSDRSASRSRDKPCSSAWGHGHHSVREGRGEGEDSTVGNAKGGKGAQELWP